MSIRWKLLILLLAIALVPLLFISVLNRASLRSLSLELAQEAQRQLIQQTSDQLAQLIAGHAEILRLHRDAVAAVVRLQADAVEQRLAARPDDRARPLMAADFDRPADLPFKLYAAPGQMALARSGDSKWAPPCSYNAPAFHVAPGGNADALRDDQRRLAGLAPELRTLFEQKPELIYAQYTVLDNGLMCLYPGRGGVDPNLDLRQTGWYRTARETPGVQWYGPLVEPESGRSLLTAALAVHRPDGSPAGVTAAQVAEATLARSVRLPGRFSGDVRAFLVSMQPRPGDQTVRPMVLGRPGLSSDAEPERDAPPAWLDSDDAEGIDAVSADMLRGTSGSRRMRFDGRDSLWVYGPIAGSSAHLALIVPYDQVIQRALALQRDVNLRTEQILTGARMVALLVLLLVVLVALVGSRTVTEPVRDLASAADRIARGEWEARVPVRTRDELGQLAAHFNAMVPQLQDRMRLKQSLQLAMEVQQHLLPSSPPRIAGLDIAGASVYCDETGGDYYDFLDLSELGPQQLGVAIGDVTGHGVAAAMLMATGRALLRSRASQPGSLSELMNAMNHYLSMDLLDGRFMTLYYLVIDARARRMHWISAGHDAAIVYDAARGEFGELAGLDLPLGVDARWKYQECGPADLTTGQVIVLGTDGIWEARNPRGEFYGKERLRAVIRAHAGEPAQAISAAITAALSAFRGGGPVQDDVTLVVVKPT